jgi:hypothetical protein
VPTPVARHTRLLESLSLKALSARALSPGTVPSRRHAVGRDEHPSAMTPSHSTSRGAMPVRANSPPALLEISLFPSTSNSCSVRRDRLNRAGQPGKATTSATGVVQAKPSIHDLRAITRSTRAFELTLTPPVRGEPLRQEPRRFARAAGRRRSPTRPQESLQEPLQERRRDGARIG